MLLLVIYYLNEILSIFSRKHSSTWNVKQSISLALQFIDQQLEELVLRVIDLTRVTIEAKRVTNLYYSKHDDFVKLLGTFYTHWIKIKTLVN